MNEIKQSWEEFLKKPFPNDYAGVEIEEIDLTSLDTFTAGCIDTFVERGRLDRKQINILKGCSGELDKIVLHLNGEAKEYYEHLRILAERVLRDVS